MQVKSIAYFLSIFEWLFYIGFTAYKLYISKICCQFILESICKLHLDFHCTIVKNGNSTHITNEACKGF